MQFLKQKTFINKCHELNFLNTFSSSLISICVYCYMYKVSSYRPQYKIYMDIIWLFKLERFSFLSVFHSDHSKAAGPQIRWFFQNHSWGESNFAELSSPDCARYFWQILLVLQAAFAIAPSIVMQRIVLSRKKVVHCYITSPSFVGFILSPIWRSFFYNKICQKTHGESFTYIIINCGFKTCETNAHSSSY